MFQSEIEKNNKYTFINNCESGRMQKGQVYLLNIHLKLHHQQYFYQIVNKSAILKMCIDLEINGKH